MNLNKNAQEIEQLIHQKFNAEFSAGKSLPMAEIISALAEHGEPVKNALVAVPDEIYLLSRVTLAANFIYPIKDNDGNLTHGFNVEGYEQAWKFISTPPETDENSEQTELELEQNSGMSS
jgi:hypothetical protein